MRLLNVNWLTVSPRVKQVIHFVMIQVRKNNGNEQLVEVSDGRFIYVAFTTQVSVTGTANP